MLDAKLSHPKLHEVVAERLTALIIKGDFLPGENLPTERELMGRLSVSRGVVREATKILEAKGLVTIRPGAGVIVAHPNGEQLTNSFSLFVKLRKTGMNDLLELRQCLEVEAAGFAAVRATPADIAELEEICQRMAEEIADAERFIVFDLQFHRQIAAMSRNMLFGAVLDSLSDALLESRRVSAQVENGLVIAVQAHRRIMLAIAQHDSFEARTQMRLHIDQTRDDFKRIVGEEHILASPAENRAISDVAQTQTEP